MGGRPLFGCAGRGRLYHRGLRPRGVSARLPLFMSMTTPPPATMSRPAAAPTRMPILLLPPPCAPP